MIRMKRYVLGVLVAAVASATSSFAAVVTPTDFGGPFCLSPAFGPATCMLTNEYAAGGLSFSGMGVATATFIDPPPAWGGINGAGMVDLLAPVNGMIVVPGTSTPGITNFISVEAGNAGLNTLQLSVFDGNGNLLASVLNDGSFGVGPHGRDLMTISVPGIHSFSVSTPGHDTFGVDQIDLGPITALSPAPTVSMSGVAVMALFLFALGYRRLAAR